MSSHIVFNGVDDHVKARLEALWEKKLPRIQKVLVPYRSDLQEIDLAIYSHQQSPQREWYEARAAIHLPTGTLAAQATDKDPRAVLDRVTEEIVKEIKRHKERVRKDYLFRRKTRPRADLKAVGALLEEHVRSGRREEFFRQLRPLLSFLADHAHRELRSLERSGLLHRRELTVADLMDELLTRAWQRFANRPRKLALDLWLTDLLHDIFEEWIKEEPRPHLSLEERADKLLGDRAPKGDEEEWWTEVLKEEDEFALEDLIPGTEAADAWDQLEAREQREKLLTVLDELPAAQRQALLLHALEDFSLADIATLQDRSESEVQADIEAARRTLRERLAASGFVEESREPVAAANASAETVRN